MEFAQWRSIDILISSPKTHRHCVYWVSISPQWQVISSSWSRNTGRHCEEVSGAWSRSVEEANSKQMSNIPSERRLLYRALPFSPCLRQNGNSSWHSSCNHPCNIAKIICQRVDAIITLPWEKRGAKQCICGTYDIRCYILLSEQGILILEGS